MIAAIIKMKLSVMVVFFFMNNFSLTEKDKKFLLGLARQSIAYFLQYHKPLEIDEKELENYSPTIKQKRGCFVTLTIDNELRGCIGCFESNKPLYQTIIEMAISAAFFDYRFSPLSKEELEQIKIEISILTPPQELKYNDALDLLQKLKPLKHGVIIIKGNYQATYLPQVWEQIPGKEEFINSLCLKAGLPFDCWKKEKLDVKIYEVESFKE